MLSPDCILACWEESQVTDTDFVWQVQYFRCLREVLCDPTSLCGRCNIFDALREVLRGLTFFLCGRCNIFRCLREVPAWPGPMIACDPTSFLRGRCNPFNACDPTYLWGRVASDYFLALPTHPLVAWPYLYVRIACDPIDNLWPLPWVLRGRCNNFDASEMLSPDRILAKMGRVSTDRQWQCQPGAIVSDAYEKFSVTSTSLVWQVQYLRCLPRSSPCFSRSFCMWYGCTM